MIGFVSVLYHLEGTSYVCDENESDAEKKEDKKLNSTEK